MALTTYEEILRQVRESADELREARYPEDLIREAADSECPIYNNEILAQWYDLDPEYWDMWQEVGANKDSTILQLMMVDLYFYYDAMFSKAWAEVQEELEATEELV